MDTPNINKPGKRSVELIAFKQFTDQAGNIIEKDEKFVFDPETKLKYKYGTEAIRDSPYIDKVIKDDERSTDWKTKSGPNKRYGRFKLRY
jgi:hypothetical protein